MYPLVLLIGVAAWRGRVRMRWIAGSLAGAGLAVAAYHYALERMPSLDRGACDPRAPCTVTWVLQLGYISIPMMAATAFALVIVLLVVAGPAGRGRDAPDAAG
jgi:disulfide bond formation protein DsbB